MTGDRRASWSVQPVTPDRWADLEQLFGERGACAGCWCMWWRLPRREFNTNSGEQNRAALRRLVRKNREPGLLGYEGEEPVAWISLGPRPDFAALGASRILAPVDERPVWSVVCFFIRRDRRRRGWMVRLLRAAVAYAADHGATRLEGYPVEVEARALSGSSGFTGVASAFRKAGFREVARRKADRPVMRRAIRRRRT